jgi:hypothetical protein
MEIFNLCNNQYLSFLRALLQTKFIFKTLLKLGFLALKLEIL